MHDEFDLRQVRACASKIIAGQIRLGLMISQYPHNFAWHNLAHDFAIDPPNGVEFAGPVARIMRPGQPGRFVPFPFRGQGKAERSGGRIV